jgi:succinate-acetate transporter protein
MAFAVIVLPPTGVAASLIEAKVLSQGVGVFLLGWTIFTGLMLIATFRISGALIAVFALLFLTFLSLTIGWLGGLGTGTFTTFVGIGGWLGIITALAAWYAALAGVLASVKLANLPTMPMSRS